MGVAQMASVSQIPVSIFTYSQFIAFGGLAVGLIGIGVALLGLPDR